MIQAIPKYHPPGRSKPALLKQWFGYIKEQATATYRYLRPINFVDVTLFSGKIIVPKIFEDCLGGRVASYGSCNCTEILPVLSIS